MCLKTKEDGAGSLAVACVLSLLSLAKLSRKTKLIYYRRLFPVWNVVAKLLPGSEQRLVRLLAGLFRVQIKPIPCGSELREYPALHAVSEERATDVAFRCSGEMIDRGPLAFLARRFPKQCLQSFAIKNGLASSVHHTIRGVKVLRRLHPGASRLILAVEPGWPESLTTAVESELKAERVTIFRVGPILKFIDNMMLRVVIASSSLRILFEFLRLHRFTLNRGPKTYYKYVTELVDPESANSGPQGCLWFVDQQAIRSDEVMGFLTAFQKRALERLGITKEEIADCLENKDFRFVSLADFPLTIRDSCFILIGMLRLVATFRQLTLTETIIWNRFIRNYLTYAPLFSHFCFEKYIHATHPDGRCGTIDNSGLITGLCEIADAITIGYQTRSVVCASHEEVFDSLHVYLSWHEANFSGHTEAFRFIGRLESVGCYAFGSPLSKDFTFHEPGIKGQTQKKQAVIFPSELVRDGRSKYTPDYSFRLLAICASLAEQHPDVRFIIKFKDPQHLQQVPQTSEYDTFRKLLSENLSVAGTQRHDYRTLMDRADIVIAVGYTTPGLEALILKKQTIIYSELGTGGAFFNRFKDLVATNPEEVHKLFLQALWQPGRFWELNREQAGLAPVGWSMSRKERAALIAQL